MALSYKKDDQIYVHRKALNCSWVTYGDLKKEKLLLVSPCLRSETLDQRKLAAV